MKKVKLISGLSALVVLSSGLTFITTACTNKEDGKKENSFNTISYLNTQIYPDVTPALYQINQTVTYKASDFSATIKGNSDSVQITKVSAVSKNSTAIVIDNKADDEFTLTGVETVNDVEVDITVEDKDGTKGTATRKVSITTIPVTPKITTSTRSGNLNNCYWEKSSTSGENLGSLTFSEEAYSDGASGIKLTTEGVEKPRYEFYRGDNEITTVTYSTTKGITFSREAAKNVLSESTLTIKVYEGNGLSVRALAYVDVNPYNSPIQTTTDTGVLTNCKWIKTDVGSNLGSLYFAKDAVTDGASGIILVASEATNPTYKFFNGHDELTGISYDIATGIVFTKEAVATITDLTTLTIKVYEGEGTQEKGVVW